TDAQFLDLLGATNLIPGPNSTEMVIHVGQARAGWRGLIVAGMVFILPAALMVAAFAWAYVRYGTTPTATWLLYGIKPVIIAVVVQALWGLGKSAVKHWLFALVGVLVFGLYLYGINELALLFGGGVLLMLITNWQRLRSASMVLAIAPITAMRGFNLVSEADSSRLSQLFWIFLKIGSVLYGSGYVLLAFLRNDFVERLGWLTNQQLLDAVAVGQFTPGPVFTTATFIGYVIAGWWGAILATIGIFLPSFILVAITHPLIPRMRRSAWLSGLLDGVNMAAVGLMAAVTWELGRAAIIDWFTALVAIAAAVALIRFKINSAWLVLAGGVLGLVAHYVL
ncbi:MAG: chromate efflux transporter, partial [Herpetosiphon sp.]|nr:chromate efflux transporter [Herpetosiphon sp.]